MNATLTPAITRIILRYASAILAAKGIGSGALATDPDVLAVLEVVVGGLMAIGVELWHGLEVRRNRAADTGENSGT